MGLEVVINQKRKEKNIISMTDIKPLQIGKIINSEYQGKIVMRTASLQKFEVIDLSQFNISTCWTAPNPDLQIEIFENVKITIDILDND